MNEVQSLKPDKTCCNLKYEVNFKLVRRREGNIAYITYGELEAALLFVYCL
jgi:hypothetical protein